MNKKLIALAVAAAIAPAAAMADSGNVTIYGLMSASVDAVNSGYDTTHNGGVNGQRVTQVNDNSSRLGFKGTEDIGNGMSAVWQVESAITADGGAGTTLGGRNTFVGLSSKTAGTVLLGRHDTPYKLATRGLDVFGDGIGDNRSIMGGGATSSVNNRIAAATGCTDSTGAAAYACNVTTTTVASAGASFDGRQSNVIAYISPTVSGVHGAIAYVAGAETAYSGNTDASKKGDAWSATGIYDNGPLFASLAYERHNIGGNSPKTVLGTTGTLGDPAGQGALAGKSEKAWKLGVAYKMDALRVGFAYEKTSDDFGTVVGNNCGDNGTSSDCMGHKAYYLSAAYTMGANVLKAAYTKAGNMTDSTKTGAKQWTVGVDHNMSKRTAIYALYTKLDNDDFAAYTLNGASNGGASAITANGTNLSTGSSPSAVSVGMKHSF